MGIDPGPTKKADFALRAKLLSAWQACQSCNDAELKQNADRAASQLAPQVSTADYDLVKRGFEITQGYEPGKYPPF